MTSAGTPHDPGRRTRAGLGRGRGPAPRGAATASYVGRKVLGSLGSLLFMLLVNFFLFRVLPGDPARSLGRGRMTTDAQREAFDKAYGLSEPLPAAVPDVPEEHLHR